MKIFILVDRIRQRLTVFYEKQARLTGKFLPDHIKCKKSFESCSITNVLHKNDKIL